jgi:hypothetical protein
MTVAELGQTLVGLIVSDFLFNVERVSNNSNLSLESGRILQLKSPAMISKGLSTDI